MRTPRGHEQMNGFVGEWVSGWPVGHSVTRSATGQPVNQSARQPKCTRNSIKWSPSSWSIYFCFAADTHSHRSPAVPHVTRGYSPPQWRNPFRDVLSWLVYQEMWNEPDNNFKKNTIMVSDSLMPRNETTLLAVFHEISLDSWCFPTLFGNLSSTSITSLSATTSLSLVT